jgi:hypothetical protein
MYSENNDLQGDFIVFSLKKEGMLKKSETKIVKAFLYYL